MQPVVLRHLEPSDYAPIIAVVDDWWGGRKMAEGLPKLFFVHFRQTNFAAVEGDAIVGFLAGFRSQTFPEQAYIHYVGVDPNRHGRGIGRMLYARFFAATRELGCTEVHCVTSPVNKTSIAFHTAMGFAIEPGDKEIDGIAVASDYDGRGGDRVRFVYRLT